jgi:hypothetical protein
LNLYLCSQDAKGGYDVYDSFICAANSAEEAQKILPNPLYKWGENYMPWCKSPEYVNVELIGVAADSVDSGVVLASYNAG